MRNTPHILVTGATGLLGRPVLRTCKDVSTWRVTGTAFRRNGPGLERIDLSQTEQISAFLDRLAPTVIIHAAAERHPDVSEKDPAGTRRLNVDATAALAQWAAARHAFLIYISSDYVFDGTAPPYTPASPTHPINAYGQSKLDGEHAVRAAGRGSAILRVPILYGEVETLDESPVTVLAKNMLTALPGERLAMENWATRYPTHTGDVATVLRQMVAHKLTHPDFSGIFHWSGHEPRTKYGMACVLARVLPFDPARLAPDSTPPVGAPRPQDCHLDSSALETLGIGQRTPFASALPTLLAPHLQSECPHAPNLTPSAV
ncbi:MAG: SDR family oxidoreductase [bacterium]